MGQKTTETVDKRRKFLRIPFRLKLTAIVTLIVLGSIWIITSLVAVMVSLEFIRTTRETNFVINSRAASGIRERLYQIRSDALLLLDINSTAEQNQAFLAEMRSLFFERNPYIASVIIPVSQEIINQSFITHNEIPLELINAWIAAESQAVDLAKAGEPILRNAAPALGVNLLALFYPWQKSGIEETAIILFSPQSLSEITGAGFNTTMVVNEAGDILVSPDFDQILGGQNISGHPLFEALWKNQGESLHLDYTEGDNRYVGAGHRVSLANAAVFSSLDYSVINEQIIATTRRNILLSLTVMFLTILVTWFFTRIIMTPLRQLGRAADMIEQGNFALDLEVKS